MKLTLTSRAASFMAVAFIAASTSLVTASPTNPDENSSLMISDGSQFEGREMLPRFSWETTPQYFMFGDTVRVLRPEEVSSIASRTDFICIEKSHGSKELGSAELGAKHEVAAFKKVKPGIKVLFYFNSAYAWPFTSYNQAFTAKNIDQYPELKKFLLVDPATGKLADRNKVYYFDVLNPEFRAWWVDTVAKGVNESGCDGAFIDQMHGFVHLRRDKKDEIEKAMGEMMTRLKNKMGPDKILLGNNAADEMAQHVFPAVDAIMFEHYQEKTLSKESLLRDWQDMLRIAQAGKMSVFRIGVEVELHAADATPAKNKKAPNRDQVAALAKERVEYYQACYLIGAQPYSYLQYGWGWTLSSGSLQVFPELQKPLGAPKGPYSRTKADGWAFTREFEHASVWVDTEKGEGKIIWK